MDFLFMKEILVFKLQSTEKMQDVGEVKREKINLIVMVKETEVGKKLFLKK